MYINGTLLKTWDRTSWKLNFTDFGTLWIGSYASGNSMFNGSIDDVMLYIGNDTVRAAEKHYQGYVERYLSGAYTSEVLHLANHTVQIDNITWENNTPEQTNITVQIRTFLEEEPKLLGLWMEKIYEGDSIWKNYADKTGSIGDVTLGGGEAGAIAKIHWTDITYDKENGTLGSYNFSGPNPGMRVMDNDYQNIMSNMVNFTACAWYNYSSSGNLVFIGGGESAGFKIECNTNYYIKYAGLEDSILISQITGVSCMNNKWTFMCAGYNETEIWAYRDGTLVSEPSNGTLIPYNNDVQLSLFGKGLFAMAFIINESKKKDWMDDVYNKMNMTWRPWTPINISNPYKPPANEINGTFAQLKFNFETVNSSKTPILYNYSIGYSNISVAAPPPEEDSCSCPDSANWYNLCSDECKITEDCDMQGNDLYLNGKGNFTIEANIHNVENIYRDTQCDVFIRTGYYITKQ